MHAPFVAVELDVGEDRPQTRFIRALCHIQDHSELPNAVSIASYLIGQW